MNSNCDYTFEHYKDILTIGKQNGYNFKTCQEYLLDQSDNKAKCAVLRHDVDLSPERSIEFAKIEHALGIKASYFFRIHANEYNCLSYEVIGLIKDIYFMGHEIGLHAEPIDINKASGFNSDLSLQIGKKILEEIISEPIHGVASHNDLTPDNNLDYFKDDKYLKYGFSYEAYDKILNLFNSSFYVTDSHPWYWRTFIKGLLTDEHECLCRYFLKNKQPIYCLTHPHIWYKKHFHRVRY